jgi:ATP-binding cassette subfamily B protein
MSLFWKYLKPYSAYIILTLVLAGIAQILSLYDPIIFGRIIDEYALNPTGRNNNENINGVVKLLAIAVGIALAARLFPVIQGLLPAHGGAKVRDADIQ